MTLAETAAELRRLHTAPELLQVVNVWDVASAKVVAALPGTGPSRLRATRSPRPSGTRRRADPGRPHARHGGEDRALGRGAGERRPRGRLREPRRDHPRAIGAGIAGANLEDELKPLGESVAAVDAAVAAADAEGVPFALNARTDAFLRGQDRPLDARIADAVERGRAYLDAGATCVFVPGTSATTWWPHSSTASASAG
jgi:hypothetical protein